MWKLTIYNMSVGTKCSDYSHQSIKGRALLDYWVHYKQQFSLQHFERVDIEALSYASKITCTERKGWISKFLDRE